MDNSFTVINPTFVEHEGFYYLEFNGGFFKGCKRCGGEGQYSFNGEHSRCYDCNNSSAKLGDSLGSREEAEKWCHQRALRRAQRDRKREAERVARVTKMQDHQELLKAADPEVFEFLMGLVIEDDTQEQYASYDEWAAATGGESTVKLEKNSFLRAMAETLRWVGPSKPFTPNMIASTRKAMEARRAVQADAAAHPAPAGRVAVTGEIVSTKVVESDFGSAFKILVKDDRGFKVWCSIPSKQLEEHGSLFSETKGRRITFTATLTPSTDDKSFAFGSRPTKGAWL